LEIKIVIKNKLLFLTIIFLFLLCPDFYFLGAEDYSSANFIVRDSVIVIAGGQSSSQNFQYFSNAGQLSPGESTSSNFIYRAGSLYYPTANSPVISATSGDAKVDFTIVTPSIGVFGNITDYKLGTSTTSGGPYTFEDVGTSLSFSKTSLANGTKYYFIIEAYAGTLMLAKSAEASATPVAPATPVCGDGTCNGSETCSSCSVDCGSCGGGGGGGGGGAGPLPPSVVTQVIFTGRAFPKNNVTLLKDAQVAATTIAGADANFQISLSGLSGGNYLFSVYGEDYQGIRSSLLTFPVSVTAGATTTVSGIFIAPTIATDKSEVKQGDNIAIFGQSVPNGEITINVQSDQPFFEKTTADKNGIYLYNFDTDPLDMGQHFTKSKAAVSGEISSFSLAMGFTVGTKNVIAQLSTKKALKGDLNSDGHVNLVDFSIAAYWYKKPLSASFAKIEIERLNGDGKIDLTDFSIMAYYWTG
jgi:hypothetical protein